MKRTASTNRRLLCLLLMLPAAAAQSVGIEEISRAFVESDFVFNRARSDIPFLPLAWIGATTYEEGQLLNENGDPSGVSFRQRSVSEATMLPLPLDRRNALLIGQWMSWTQLELSSGRDTDIFSVAVPLGWIRQTSPDWQLAAFVAPLGHLNRSDWYWEYLGGVFARWLQSERFTWLFGFYADVAPLEDFYVPYVGLTWTVNQHWTVSAVMPWPAVLYSPTPDWLLRLGVSPSYASWSADIETSTSTVKQPRIDFSSWNFGLGVERRIWNNFWLRAEAGVAGLRGFSFAGSDWQGPNSDLGTDGYLSITINFRPSVPAGSAATR